MTQVENEVMISLAPEWYGGKLQSLSCLLSTVLEALRNKMKTVVQPTAHSRLARKQNAPPTVSEELLVSDHPRDPEAEAQNRIIRPME